MLGVSSGLLKRFTAAVAFAALPFIAHAADRPFYAGKTINLIVGEPPGGGADAYARLLSRHLAKYIPGTPAIIIQNMPGAGTLKSVMYVNTTAPQDGTVLATARPVVVFHGGPGGLLHLHARAPSVCIGQMIL